MPVINDALGPLPVSGPRDAASNLNAQDPMQQVSFEAPNDTVDVPT